MLDLFACMYDPHGLVCILYIISDLMHIMWTLLLKTMLLFVVVVGVVVVGVFGGEGGCQLPGLTQSPACMFHMVSRRLHYF